MFGVIFIAQTYELWASRRKEVIVILQVVEPQFNGERDKYAQKEFASNHPTLIEKILNGRNYRVQVHFSKTSHETMEDKIIRMLENEKLENL